MVISGSVSINFGGLSTHCMVTICPDSQAPFGLVEQ